MSADSPPTIYCTTREAATLLGVSLRTVQLWAENGLLEAWKTGGGHRRIVRASIQRLLAGDAPQGRSPRVPATPYGQLKVLVVEDDRVLLKLYKGVLANWGLPVDLVTASNGIEGLIRVGRESPDILITDLAMPGMDGFQLINTLAGSSLREGMEIVVVTSLDATAIAERGGLPADIRVFPKPIPFADLRAIVAGMVEKLAAYE